MILAYFNYSMECVVTLIVASDVYGIDKVHDEIDDIEVVDQQVLAEEKEYVYAPDYRQRRVVVHRLTANCINASFQCDRRKFCSEDFYSSAPIQT